ncbi:hypothetical protein [Mycobacterium angelicum]|uniref:Uncharacterized protein n=1 Tax=Mycobacterium angelicum TaxID=470074 RepID=A0A1W9ZTM8_MYCAN|nr:hypothetical protein [Mycobacterium angelicum]MCV7199262.1 hypothetical protein [Mycobacterium angelicum]ORA21150.1 hypothetical protein BST12_13935 [Mycobacterium angelicum]
MTDVLAAVVASSALALALWGAWRPRFRAASYLVAGSVGLTLIGLLVVTGQTLMAISVAFLLAMGAPMVVFNHRRANR